MRAWLLMLLPWHPAPAAQDVGRTKKGFMGFGGGADPAPVQPSGPSMDNVMSPGRPSSGGGGGISLGSLADPNDYIAAHFDKKVNEESARQSLPVDSWRWQKRFFIFSGQGAAATHLQGARACPRG